jgi:hypothetical protein
MSTKTLMFATAAILLGSTALASAQTSANPRYWGDSRNWNGYGYNYYGGPGVTLGFGAGPGYYSPGYYDYAPGYYDNGYDNGYNNSWNDRRDWR